MNVQEFIDVLERIEDKDKFLVMTECESDSCIESIITPISIRPYKEYYEVVGITIKEIDLCNDEVVVDYTEEYSNINKMIKELKHS